jgi:molecular chaperone DnaJ
MKDYYKILGVEKNSSQDEIKKAYRKLSKQYHPDVNPSGEEMFKDIGEAYEILGDENKRKQYDNGGQNGFDIHSMFEQMMRGGRQQKSKAPDKVIEVLITPFESYFGVKKIIDLTSFDCCKSCNGEGGERKMCHTCNGKGHIIQTFGVGNWVQQVQSMCPNCSGQGSKIVVTCNGCGGRGITPKKEKLSVNIPSNVDNGDFMRVKGRGDYNLNAKTKGDVILRVTMVEENNFEKMGSDLVYKMEVTPLQLFLDEQVEIPHPDGNIKISFPDVFESEKPLRVPNKGYKYPEGTGNMYIKVNVRNDKDSNINLKNQLKDLIKQTENVPD